jgi:hypothetical protein
VAGARRAFVRATKPFRNALPTENVTAGSDNGLPQRLQTNQAGPLIVRRGIRMGVMVALTDEQRLTNGVFWMH